MTNNTTNNNNVRNNNNEVTAETMVQEAAVNMIDKWASRVAGAKTPINLKVDVSGSIGDVRIYSNTDITNGAYRNRNHTKQHAKRNRHNKNHDSGNCKCECTKDQEEKPDSSDPESLLTKEQEVHSSTDAEQQGKVAEAENELKSLEEKHETTSYTEKVADNYYNKVCKLSRTIADAKDEDILVNVLVGCQLTRKFKELNYSIRSDFSFIDERAVSKRLDFILTSFGIDTQLAQDVYNRIHDCFGFDVFTIKAKDNKVYIICGNVDGIVDTFCSANASETSMQFITRMMTANSPRA